MRGRDHRRHHVHTRLTKGHLGPSRRSSARAPRQLLSPRLRTPRRCCWGSGLLRRSRARSRACASPEAPPIPPATRSSSGLRPVGSSPRHAAPTRRCPAGTRFASPTQSTSRRRPSTSPRTSRPMAATPSLPTAMQVGAAEVRSPHPCRLGSTTTARSPSPKKTYQAANYWVNISWTPGPRPTLPPTRRPHPSH